MCWRLCLRIWWSSREVSTREEWDRETSRGIYRHFESNLTWFSNGWPTEWSGIWRRKLTKQWHIHIKAVLDGIFRLLGLSDRWHTTNFPINSITWCYSLVCFTQVTRIWQSSGCGSTLMHARVEDFCRMCQGLLDYPSCIHLSSFVNYGLFF